MKRLFTLLLCLPMLAFAQSGNNASSSSSGQGAARQQQTQSNDQDDATQASELRQLKWQNGPTTGVIGTQATVKVPKDYVFLGESDTRRFLQLAGNPPSNGNYLIAPKSLDWFAVFSFDDTGHVKDDEKIDADDLLKNLKDSDGPENEERRRLHLPALYTEGWQVPPHYDPQTKRLEWGIRLRDSSGNVNVNYTSRILGRTGVMRATLVSDVDTLTANTQAFENVLTQFAYNSGQTYAEFRSGDKVAEYGLAALILGGAAAVATKKGFWALIAGFFAAFWKLVAGAFVAIAAAVSRIFKKKQ